MKRHLFRTTLLAATLCASLGAVAGNVLTVYKSPYCGCCTKWIEHMKGAGFEVKIYQTERMDAVRQTLGIPATMGSCHTATIDGYAVEGHVPAREVKRLLAERPKAAGIAVPGMPMGSPGMEQGPTKQPFDVVLVKRDGSHSVYQGYR